MFNHTIPNSRLSRRLDLSYAIRYQPQFIIILILILILLLLNIIILYNFILHSTTFNCFVQELFYIKSD